MVLFGCMGKPGGGRAVLTAWFMRHFNIISYIELERNSIKNIYRTIMNIYLEKFNESIKDISNSLIDCTLNVY